MNIKLIILILLSFSIQFAVAEDLTFEVAGEARIENGDTVIARNMAINDAMHKAIRQAIERFLEPSAVNENMTTIDNGIFKHGLAYVNHFNLTKAEVLSGATERYSVAGTFGIAGEIIEHDLSKLGLLAFRENLPRVLVVIQEKNIDNVHWHFQAKELNNAENMIIKALGLKGFKLVDKVSLIQKITAEGERDFFADDNKRIAEIGKSFGADVVIVGKAISRPVVTLEVAGDTASTMAVISLKAIRTIDGLELATSSTSASYKDIDESKAGAQAITLASEEAAVKIIPGIIAQWAEGLEPVITITMYVNGLRSIESLVEFKNEFLNTLTGIKSFDRRTFSDGAAAYDIVSTVDVATIVNEINDKGFKSFTVKIRSFSDNSLDLNVKMKE